MLRSTGSENGGAQCGFTLLEMLIAVFLGGLVLIGLFRIYRNSLWSYNIQEQISEMHQNANYSMHLLTEKLMQAGASLPETSFTVIYIKPERPDSIVIMENQTMAEYVFPEAISNTKYIPVTDASRFIQLEQIVKISVKKAVTIQDINTTYQEHNFTNGIDTVSSPDTICLEHIVSFVKGDRIYGFTPCTYFCDNGVLYLNSTSNEIAENVDSLAITFFDKDHKITYSWPDMHFAEIYSRFRTSLQDKNYKDSIFHDGYRRISLSMDILIRNKL